MSSAFAEERHSLQNCASWGAVLLPKKGTVYKTAPAGAESLWHDDFSDVNWDKRLKNDMKLCFYFISMGNNKDISQTQLSEDLEKFSEKIKKYPKDKRQFLIDGSKKCCLCLESMLKDEMISVANFIKSENYVFSWSEGTKQLENDLVQLKIGDEISIAKKAFEKEIEKLKDEMRSAQSSADEKKDMDEYNSITKEVLNQHRDYLKRIFKNIFDEELN